MMSYISEIAAPAETDRLPTRLARSLSEAIRSGKIAAGEQLPGENEMCRQLGVSRTTLRLATQMLMVEGLLERRHGVGTFVSRRAGPLIANDVAVLLSTTELIRGQGYAPAVSGCVHRVAAASGPIATSLGVEAGSPVLHISRTRTADGHPVIHCEEYVPETILHEDEVPANRDWSLYELLATRGHEPAYSRCKISAVVADNLMAVNLQVERSVPLVLFTQVIFDRHDAPVLYCETHQNTTMLDLEILRRKR